MNNHVNSTDKPKILFWLDADFTHFVLAYFLQKRYDCELYAIVDITNKPKKFFETQKLVNFKKIWYFHDNIQATKEHDVSYLQEIENKYGINLWKLAINERIFHRFFDFHKFSRNEILSITQQSVNLFEKIFQDVDLDFFISSAPVFFHTELFYEICKKKNIKCLLLSMPKLGGKSLVSEVVYRIDGVKNLDNLEFTNRTAEEILSYIQDNNPYDVLKKYRQNYSNSKFDYINSALQYAKNDNSHEKTHYTYFGRNKFKVLSNVIKFSMKKRIREDFMKNNLITHSKFTTPYVYFPMSVDMERNILIDTPFYTDQIEIIRIIAKSLPVNYRLIVKENPGQSHREWRPISEYKQIMSIPNVSLVHPHIIGSDLIKNSSLVISLAGSSPLEATFYKKPAIVFGNVIYSLIPTIVKVKELEKLPDLIKQMLTTKIDLSYLNKFIDLIERNTANFDMFEFQTKFNEKFYFSGSLFDVELNEQEIRQFLDEIQEYFEELIDLHIKKIQKHTESISKN